MRNPLHPGFYDSSELRSFGFGAVGANVRVSHTCTVIGAENVFLGDNVRIDSQATIVATEGILRLSGWNHIGGQSHLSVAADLTLGDYAGTSQGVRIYTATDDFSGRAGSGAAGVYVRPVEIARFVGIGSGAVVLPGCHIREGSCVGALSLVNRPLRPWGIYHGNPVRRIGDRPRAIDDLLTAVRRRVDATLGPG